MTFKKNITQALSSFEGKLETQMNSFKMDRSAIPPSQRVLGGETQNAVELQGCITGLEELSFFIARLKMDVRGANSGQLDFLIYRSILIEVEIKRASNEDKYRKYAQGQSAFTYMFMWSQLEALKASIVQG